jgi:hypothetical protein
LPAQAHSKLDGKSIARGKKTGGRRKGTWQLIVLPFRPAVFDRHILPLDKTSYLQALSECGERQQRAVAEYLAALEAEAQAAVEVDDGNNTVGN